MESYTWADLESFARIAQIRDILLWYRPQLFSLGIKVYRPIVVNLEASAE
jgi:hypothetical protein